MNVSYSAPLGRAWRRAKTLLFHPFRLDVWLIVGFTAWLSSLIDGAWWAAQYSGSGFSGDEPAIRMDVEDIQRWPEWLEHTWQRILAGGVLLYTVLSIALGLLVITLVLLWIQSRAKFVFLDSVARGEAKLSEPWRAHAALGHSLFWWNLAYGFATMVLGVALAILVILSVIPVVLAADGGAARFGPLAGLALVSLLALVLVQFVGLLVEAFVIPVMYRHRIGVLDAWRRFLPLLNAHLPAFILYALFVLVLYVGYLVGVGVVGIATCCCGFMVLSVPFVGTVLLLPVHATYRALSAEFLAQFGEEWSVFPPGRDTGS